jgi:alpha/beta superfamily hydrolase
MQEQNEDASEFWLAGHGFGAWCAMQLLMRRIEVTGYISILPPIKKHDFSFFNPAPCDGIIVGASANTTTPDEGLRTFSNSINRQKSGKCEFASVRDADYQFNGRLRGLFETLTGYIGRRAKKA